jgi:hypothetical protein
VIADGARLLAVLERVDLDTVFLALRGEILLDHGRDTRGAD